MCSIDSFTHVTGLVNHWRLNSPPSRAVGRCCNCPATAWLVIEAVHFSRTDFGKRLCHNGSPSCRKSYQGSPIFGPPSVPLLESVLRGTSQPGVAFKNTCG